MGICLGTICPQRAKPVGAAQSASRELRRQPSYQSRDLVPSGDDHHQSAESGRAALKTYVESTLKKLEDASPSKEDLKSKIEPNVVTGLQRLSSGAPVALRNQLKQALVKNHVMPDHKADKEQFVQGLKSCLAAIDQAAAPAKAPAPARKPAPEPTEAELKSFNACIVRLWEIDAPLRLAPMSKDGYVLNHQSRAGSHAEFYDAKTGDSAKDPLFTSVNTKKLFSDPLSRAFIALLDNYEHDATKSENVTPEEKREMDVFMHILMNTPHMKYVHKILQNWCGISPDVAKFQTVVFEMWFVNYAMTRGGAKSSSGFEHVFVGELSAKGGLSGMHNWLNFFREEQAGRLNYKGYIGCITAEDQRLVKVRFNWGEEEKNVSTFLVGTSPAFQFAFMTLAFLGYDGECKASGIYFGEVGPVQVTTYSWNSPMGKHLRSAFLEGS